MSISSVIICFMDTASVRIYFRDIALVIIFSGYGPTTAYVVNVDCSQHNRVYSTCEKAN